jgi:hypothetical protein
VRPRWSWPSRSAEPSGADVEELGAGAPRAVAEQREPLVAADGRPAGRAHRVVDPVGDVEDRRAGHRVDEAQVGVHDVAALGVADREDPRVLAEAAHTGRLGAPVDLAQPAAVADGDDEAVGARHAHGDGLGPDGEPGAPALGEVGDVGLGGAALERRDDVAADLAAAVVVEPDDARAVGCGPAAEDAGLLVGDLRVDVGVEVPRHRLPHPARVRGVDAAVRRVGGPGGQADAGGAEAADPGGGVGHAVAPESSRCRAIASASRSAASGAWRRNSEGSTSSSSMRRRPPSPSGTRSTRA